MALENLKTSMQKEAGCAQQLAHIGSPFTILVEIQESTNQREYFGRQFDQINFADG